MIEFRALRPDELDAWCRHCHSVFVGDVDGYFRGHFEMDPFKDTSLIFIAVDDGEIVSTVCVFDRTIWIGGRAVRMGGIGEVSTKSAYRRQGLAGKLLEISIGAMNERGMPVSVLFGNQALYQRMGWRFCGTSWTVVDAAKAALPEGLSIRAFDEGDLPCVMGLYDLFAGRLDGVVIRSEAYWKQWVLPQWRKPVVLARDGQAVGYFTGQKWKDAYVVDELCAAPGMERVLTDAVAHTAFSLGCGKVRVRSALLPELSGVRETEERAMMVRLNGEFCGVADSDALVQRMEACAGFFWVDGF